MNVINDNSPEGHFTKWVYLRMIERRSCLLNKFIVIRGTVKPTERRRTRSHKDDVKSEVQTLRGLRRSMSCNRFASLSLSTAEQHRLDYSNGRNEEKNMLKREKAPRAVNRAAVCMVLVSLVLVATSTARAQKKPPLLSDSDISAFNKDQIQKLATTASDTTKPEAAQLARNKLIAIAVEQVDTAFNDYRTKDRKRTQLLNFIFDFLEIGAASTISLITGGLRAKSVIAEGLALFQGSRAAFNKDFKFLERQLLFDKMVAKRSAKLTAIYKKLNQDVLEYPWEQARSELRDYFFAGTIDEALSSLSRDTGQEAAGAVTDLENAKRAAGILGKVTPQQLTADKAFAAAIDPIAAAHEQADKDLTKANADIAAAQKIITDETAKPAAAQDAPAIAAAQTAKAAAETAKATATQTKATKLQKMKTIYNQVADNPTLAKLLPTISTGAGIQPRQRQRIEDSLKNASENSGTFEDYQRVLGNLRRVVVDMVNKDPRPNDEFQKILVANQ